MSAEAVGNTAAAHSLGLQPGNIVAEAGWDEDTDDSVRLGIEETIGSEMLDEDTDEVVDAVLLWWREDDGDLADGLMDVITPLSEQGFVCVLTPKTGQPGYVPTSDIAEAADTAGLVQTTSINLGDWIGSRLVQPKSVRQVRR